ncbi:MAG: hypothetical protein ACK43M_14525 [Allorhizobium sp.]
MATAGISRIYGNKGFKSGHHLASLTISCHTHARLLEEILQRELRERAGTKDEAILAQWNNDLAETRRRAIANEWTGWEDHA